MRLEFINVSTATEPFVTEPLVTEPLVTEQSL